MLSRTSWLRVLAAAVFATTAFAVAMSLPGCASAPSTPTSASSPPERSPHSVTGITARTGGHLGRGVLPLPPENATGTLTGTAPASGWNVPTNTPVRTTAAAYGAYVRPAASDLLIYAVDNYKPSTITAPGITAATAPTSIANWSSLTSAQQTEAEQSTVFVLTNNYAPTPTLLAWSNSATASFTKIPFGLSYLLLSYDTTNLELYALSQNGNLFCWDVPSPASSSGYAASQVGALSTCAGWSTSGKGTGGTKVTYSAPFPTAVLAPSGGSDFEEMYWGDDSGNLNCVRTGVAGGDAGVGAAPSACSSAYTSGAFSLGATSALGPPYVEQVGGPTAPENWIFIGSADGTMYRVDDLQTKPPSISVSMFCTSTGTAGARCPASNTADYAIFGGVSYPLDEHAWISHGTLYQFYGNGSGLGGAWETGDIAQVSLFTPTPGAPTFSFPSLGPNANSASGSMIFAGNDHVYSVAFPGTSAQTVYSAPLYRQTLPASLAVSSATTVSVPAGSAPLGGALGWYESIYAPSGYGSALSGGSVGAPVSGGTLTATLSGGIEQFGCATEVETPTLVGVTSLPHGALVETQLLQDYENGNLNFGYDTGGAAPTGGFVQYPMSSGWACPSPSTTGSACGSAACNGPLAAGSCVNDSDCAATASTPYCDIFPDFSFGTCVACRTDSQCPQPAGAYEVCDTNNGAYACVPTARCATSGNCTNTTDDPDYNTTLTSCNTTVGTTAYGLCALCVSNTTCAPFTSTPVCDQKNAASSEFGNCVECTADTDCTGNDDYENAGLIHCDQTPGSPNFDHCAACTNNTECSGGQVCATTTASASTTYFDTCVSCDSNAQCPGPLATCDLTVAECVCSAVDSECPSGSTCDTAAGLCSP